MFLRDRLLVHSATLLIALGAAACGGSSESESGTGGAGGSGGVSSGGASTGGASTGGASTGGASTGGGPSDGGAPGGGGAGGAACTAEAGICKANSECVLTAPSCCLCGMPELSDYVAVNQASASVCGCGGSVCACAVAINPNLAATCTNGKCNGFDVRKEAQYASCLSDGDCRLRLGLDCCEPCSGNAFQLVSIKTTSEPLLKAALCDGNEACSKCLPQYPAEKKAACVAGFCQVVDP